MTPAPLRLLYARATAVRQVGGKTVSSRSKTGDPACSAAVSEWKTKGQTKGSPLAKKLAECRAKARQAGQARQLRHAGQDLKAAVIEHRIASGKPITRKDRDEIAKALAAGRSERQIEETKRRVAELAGKARRAAADGPPGGATPRQQAASLFHSDREDEAEYAFARPSAVPNAGEDLARSARHVRNAWRGLDDAERNGSADKLVRRDSLLKLEPMTLAAGLGPKNALATLGAYLAVKAFKPAPLLETKMTSFRGKKYDAQTLRHQYYDAFKAIREVAEQAARTELSPFAAASKVAAKARDLLREAQAKDRLSPHAETLRLSYNAMVGRGSSSPFGQINDFGRHLQKRYQAPGTSPTAETLDRAAGHVADLLDGRSMNETFDVSSERRKPFNPAELYLGEAKRTGGRSIPGVSDPAAATKFMTVDLKMRGVQFGNSMTDDERRHHLKFTAESFADLADVTGLPEKFMSLDGALGVAFGARGKGTAMAHYEPDLKVINLTRKNGVGSLAHEWGHAFDNWLGARLTGRKDDAYFSEYAPRDKVHRYRPGTGHEAIDVPDDDVTRAFRDWHAVSGAFTRRASDWLSTSREGRQMSQQKRDYWRSTREAFARAFESHVARKLKGEGRENTYLTAGVTHELWPTEDESRAMAPAFDRIFAAFKTKQAGGPA